MKNRSLITVILIVIIVAGLGLWLYQRSSKGPISKPQYPEYLNFDGNYVLSPPKNYTVDEHSLEGVALIYKGQIQAVTADDIFNQGGMSVEPIKDLTDHSSSGFKNYVNNNFLPQLMKNLSTNNVKAKFVKQNGADAALVTIDNGSKPYRYLKGGQHPAVLTAKQQSQDVKAVEDTMRDVESSDLSGQIDGFKNIIKSTVQQVKDQKAADIIASASDDFKSKTNTNQLGNILKSASPYTSGNATISGVSYNPTDFAVRIKFVKLDKNDQTPAFGDMGFKKVNDQWQLVTLTLPTPKQ